MQVNSDKSELHLKLKQKFGKDFERKDKAPKAESVDSPATRVSIDSSGKKEVGEEPIGDIKSNDPKSEVTQEKLRAILKTGAFNFNDKERQALSSILGA